MEDQSKFTVSVRCPVCKRDIPTTLQPSGVRTLKVHGSITLGGKNPFKKCRGSDTEIRTVVKTSGR